MKQLYYRIALIIVFTFVFVGFVPNFASASVNDFKFSSFEADYYLSKDSEGHSTMKVVEKLTAEFVNFNQNKGIERAIPIYYDGHSVSFQLKSLTRNGQTEPIYDQKQDGDFEIISTGTDEYLNGTQAYVFTYTLRDVVKNFDNHQELYWDTNGTGWTQQFDSLTVRVHLDDSIKGAFTGAVSCYQGRQGLNKNCLSKTVGSVVTFNSDGPLNAGENLSLDLSFKAGTFIDYQTTIGDLLPFGLMLMAIISFIFLIVVKIRYGRNRPGKGTIIAEYLPPADVSVLLAAEISNKMPKSSTAQIIDLAVRHKIKIIESEKKALFGKSTDYTIELIDINGLDQNELSFIDVLFGNKQIGSNYTFNKYDSAKAMQMKKIFESIKKDSENKGYRVKKSNRNTLQIIIMILMYSLAGIAMFISLGNNNDVGITVGIIVIIGLIIFTSFFKLSDLRPLTDKGRELYDYLKGLEMYIKLAEADRIRVLQSPEGAERKPVDTDDTASMIILYERVLPYAVLFGIEKDWLKHIGTFYESTKSSPDWYNGVNGFNAAMFVSSVSSFSSYSSSSSFSSSSGAGGGGFSGGGGGGGGGGGR